MTVTGAIIEGRNTAETIVEQFGGESAKEGIEDVVALK